MKKGEKYDLFGMRKGNRGRRRVLLPEVRQDALRRMQRRKRRNLSDVQQSQYYDV